MYNLTVAEAHTFFVGDGQWLVHNTRTWKHLDAKKQRQAIQRGWDDADVTDILDNAVEIKASTYKGTGDQTTVYYCSDGHYVVRNDTTGDIFHVSDTADPMWMDSFDEVVRQRP